MLSHRIATLTLNPALDVSAETVKIVPQEKLRCHDVRRDPGGGGINAARVVRRLGAGVTAVFPSGGVTGTMLEQALARDGIHCIAVPIAAETREDFSVFERASGQQFRFVLPGPALHAEELTASLNAFDAAPGDLAVFSGSLPESVSPSCIGEMARRVKARKRKLMVDTSGATLAAAVAEGVWLIKPNRLELEALAGRPLDGEAALLGAARAIVERGGADYVALTLGGEGARLIGQDGAWAAAAPTITPLSTVGAGDSFLAGLVWALAHDLALDEALRYAVAAGSAALLSPGTELAHAANVLALAERVTVATLA